MISHSDMCENDNRERAGALSEAQVSKLMNTAVPRCRDLAQLFRQTCGTTRVTIDEAVHIDIFVQEDTPVIEDTGSETSTSR